MSKRIVLGAGISAVVALCLFWLFWPGEEDRIRDQFDELSALGSKTGHASPLSDALRLKELGDLFSAKIVLKTGGRAGLAGEYTNRELMNRFGRIRVFAKRLELRFEELEFLSIQDTEAKVTVKVHAGGTDKQGNTHGEDFQAEVLLQKSEGDWKFSHFTYLDPLP